LRIKYLGYIISPEGITLSNRHIEAVQRFPIPKKILDIQRFLGLTNYFRKFIKDYASKARPLNLLKKSFTFKFDKECIIAFDLLKKELISAPVLSIYNPHKTTEVHTDASTVAMTGIFFTEEQ